MAKLEVKVYNDGKNFKQGILNDKLKAAHKANTALNVRMKGWTVI